MSAEMALRIERLEAKISKLTIHLIEHHQINCCKNQIHEKRDAK